MIDKNQVVQKEFKPQVHAYNDPDLSPIEFLTAVYHATHLPMASRIQAASALLPYTNSFPSPVRSSVADYVQGYVPYHCKIIIGGLGPSETTEICSENLHSADKTLARGGEAGNAQNLTTNPEPSTFIDYSTPPTPDELQAIKAAVNRLRPDLAHHPVPAPHLCGCGHWIFGPCPLGDSCRDRSKLN
jgi:hypothetical protein